MYICLQVLADDGTVSNRVQIDEWKQKDVDVRTFIYSTMKPEKQVTLQGCTTAFEMRGRILTEYAQVSAENEPLSFGCGASSMRANLKKVFFFFE